MGRNQRLSRLGQTSLRSMLPSNVVHGEFPQMLFFRTRTKLSLNYFSLPCPPLPSTLLTSEAILVCVRGRERITQCFALRTGGVPLTLCKTCCAEKSGRRELRGLSMLQRRRSVEPQVALVDCVHDECGQDAPLWLARPTARLSPTSISEGV